MFWRERERESDERTCGNPLMTFQIKKRISSELFIDKMTALYVGEARIRVIRIQCG